MTTEPTGRHAAPPSLCIFLPCLNEALGIAEAIDDARRSLVELQHEGLVGAHHVLVVDDGSTDGTSKVVRPITEDDPAVTLCLHPHNRGVGGSLRTALGHCGEDLILYTDADMPVDLVPALRTALPLLDSPGVGMVAGRRRPGTGEGPVREWFVRVYELMARTLFGVRIPDVNFPFKLMPTALARKLALTSEGAFVDLELLIRLQQERLEVVSIPLTYRPRVHGTSVTLTRGVLAPLARELLYAALHPRTMRRDRANRG